MADFIRPKEGFRYIFGGWKADVNPDSLTPQKYALAINVRAFTETALTTRPGMAARFTAVSGQPITNLRAFAVLNSDDAPVILARDAAGNLITNTGLIGGTIDDGTALGCSMIPFRPGASPQPYMYIGAYSSGPDGFRAGPMLKVSTPSSLGAYTVANMGIAEPQVSPDATIFLTQFASTGANPGWVAGGTAAAVANGSRLSDTVINSFIDPAPNAIIWSVQVSPTIVYNRLMSIAVHGQDVLLQDVFPPLPPNISITGIYYFPPGPPGRCVITTGNLIESPGATDTSVNAPNLLASLRRGALIQVGVEVVYVWSVATGPDGTIAIETSTVNTHTTADTISGVPAIQLQAGVPTTGNALTVQDVTYQVTTGIGTQSVAIANPFVTAGIALQDDDYISMGFKVDNLANVTEMKILLDVSDGTFTKDFYFYAVRPSDIQAGVGNTLTQLGVTQLATQRAIIDAEAAIENRNQGKASSSAQLLPGSQVWSQIIFKLSDLTRVGSDLSKSLQNVVKIQVLWNASGTINVAQTEMVFFGGYQPEVAFDGAPYLYRYRPRSSVTGARGNPSPETRYGVNPRREQVQVTMPGTIGLDPQIDTWDVFRYGGSVSEWRKIGQIAPAVGGAGVTKFIDNYPDEAALEGELLEEDNFQPFPTIDLPLTGITASVVGTTAIINFGNSPTPNKYASYLPGTLVQLGTQNVYTLRARPVLINPNPTLTYRFEFIENAGASAAAPVIIQEPNLAAQRVPYMWGPDASGTVFAVGDLLKPGTVYFTKNYNLDSGPDSFNIEMVQPYESLTGGEVLDGISWCASNERWWAMYSQNNPAQRYSVIEQPIPRGLAAPFGHCADGRSIYFWAKDGIWSTTEGSLTDADLYSVFPHDGVPGNAYTYNGVTIQPPDYSRAGTFRLEYSNHYLYAVYQDSTGTYRQLTYDTRRKTWCVDQVNSSAVVTSVYHIEGQEGSLLTSGTLYPMLVFGTATGVVAQQKDFVNDLSTPITCTVATMEWNGGDTRAQSQWGDLWLDTTPAAVAGVLAQPASGSTALGAPTTVPSGAARVQSPISVGGQQTVNFLGLFTRWTDDFSVQTQKTLVNVWQPSFLTKPETIQDRITDWYAPSGGNVAAGAAWFQGFILHADTKNLVKGLVVRDADLQGVHAFLPAVQHNGEQTIAYAFTNPFIAHLVRLEPTDQVPWRLFEVEWITQATPEFAETWQTQPSVFGMKGYMHIRQMSITYSATAPVTLTITAQDGTSPQAIVLASTSGQVTKTIITPTFNKGQLYVFRAASALPFQVYQDQCEVLVGAWRRGDNYLNVPLVGGPGGDQAKV